MKACRGDGHHAEEALRGAAHRAAPRRLARLGTVRADFERSLADPVDPAIADYVRVTVALTVLTTDVADALTIAWDAFRNAAGDDLGGWEVAVTAVDQLPGFVSACDS
jgi:hypothetical protein